MRSDSPRATMALAAKLAETVTSKKPSSAAVIFGLKGELGSGKTSFIQGFTRGLGITRRVTSPSFLIMRRYKTGLPNFTSLFHVDAYRIENPKELTALGFKEIIKDPHSVVLVEWADKVKKLLPNKAYWITFEHGEKENERIIEISE